MLNITLILTTLVIFLPQTIAATMGDVIRNECDRQELSVLKGHYILTGIKQLDNELCLKTARSLPLCNNVQIRKNREIALGLIRHQIKTELGAFYGIDCSLSDFYSTPEESEPIDLEIAKTRINTILGQGLMNGDPAFAVIGMERALFAKEAPKTYMMGIIQHASGTPSIPEDFRALENLLTLAMSGNTIAAQYAWQDKRIPNEWVELSFLQQSTVTRKAIQQLSDIRSQPFQYLLARSLFIETEFDNDRKMEILANLDIEAGYDYWGILYYINLIRTTKPNAERGLSEENAIIGWHTYFANAMQRPLSQFIAIRPLLKKDGKPLPRGYITALRRFAEMPISDPLHLVLRKIVKKTKALEIANCYIKKFLYDFPETCTLSNEDKIAEINAIAEIIPQAKGNLALIIQNSIPAQSLGYFERSSEQRRDALQELADDGVHLAADFLVQANTGGIAQNPFDTVRIHFGYQDVGDIPAEEQTTEHYMTITQKRLANIFHLAFTGSRMAQNFLTEKTKGTSDLLQFHLNMNKALGIAPAGEQQEALNKEAHPLLRHAFQMINILTQPHNLTGGPINFHNEIECLIGEVEKE
ncbi:MAG: hypothetical protein V4482_00175 [Pseudomonadota bacterium]